MKTCSVIRILGMGAIFGLLGGCVSSHVAKHWGEAAQLDAAAMIANPEAPYPDAPEGLDSETAERVVQRYYHGQEAQPQRPVTTVVIGED